MTSHRSIGSDLRDSRVLVVDDEVSNVRALAHLLERAGYRCVRTVTDALEVSGIFEAWGPDLVLLDLHMPRRDGFQVMAELRELSGVESYVPILVLTGDTEPDTRLRALDAGARDFVTKPFEATEVLLRIRNLLETRHLHTRISRHADELEAKVRERTVDLERAQAEILRRLALAAEYRDDVTGQHAQRVGVLSALIAERLGLPDEEIRLLRRAAPLHDVGKIGIPDAILMKPGPLTPAELAVMKSHAEIGQRILDGSDFPLLQTARDIAYSHHERWDGHGYHGIAGEDIPLVGRIVAVADAFDSLTHDRPYKRASPMAEAICLIRADRGLHFDPRVVDAFLEVARSGRIAELGLLLDDDCVLQGGEPGEASPVDAPADESVRSPAARYRRRAVVRDSGDGAPEENPGRRLA